MNSGGLLNWGRSGPTQNRVSIWVILLTAGALASPVCWAESYLHPWQPQFTPRKVLRGEPTLGRYSTTSNYNDKGVESKPAGFISYSKWNADFFVGYGLADMLSVYGRMEWINASMSITGKDSNSFGLGDQALGVHYRVFEWGSGSTFSIQGQLELPLYSLNGPRSEGTPGLGDQSVDATGGGFLHLVLWKGKTAELGLTGGGALTWRSSSYSPHIPWSVGARYLPIKSGLIIGILGYGQYSLSKDSHGFTTSASGGSFVTEAKNATIMNAQGELGYRINKEFDLSFLGSASINGKNAPKGTYLAATASFRWGGEKDVDPLRLEPEEYAKSNKGFIEYTFEAKVTATNDRLNLVRISKGNESGVAVGQTYDIFKPGPDGSPGKPIARAKVTSVKEGEAVLTVKEYFKEVWIEEGFLVKRPLQ